MYAHYYNPISAVSVFSPTRVNLKLKMKNENWKWKLKIIREKNERLGIRYKNKVIYFKFLFFILWNKIIVTINRKLSSTTSGLAGQDCKIFKSVEETWQTIVSHSHFWWRSISLTIITVPHISKTVLAVASWRENVQKIMSLTRF